MKWDREDIIVPSDPEWVNTSRKSASPSTRCVSQQVLASTGVRCLDNEVYCLRAKGGNHKHAESIKLLPVPLANQSLLPLEYRMFNLAQRREWRGWDVIHSPQDISQKATRSQGRAAGGWVNNHLATNEITDIEKQAWVLKIKNTCPFHLKTCSVMHVCWLPDDCTHSAI